MTVMKGIVSGLVGAAAFIIFLFVINASTLLSVSVGIVAFIAVFLIMYLSSSSSPEIEIHSVSEEFYRTTLKEGRKKLATIHSEVDKITDYRLKGQGVEILGMLDKIFRALEEDPKDVKIVREFFSYYLDVTIKILQKFNQLSKNNLKGETYTNAYTQMTENLDMLNKFYDSVLHKILEDEFMDLDTELKTLNQMLKVEGIEK